MRKIVGALLAAGLALGCGGSDSGEMNANAADLAPSETSDTGVRAAALCSNTQPHITYYYSENGVECGALYIYCDGHGVQGGCATGNPTRSVVWCGCP
jgi:hypothetical protein